MSIVQTERVIGVYHYDYTDSTTGSHDGSDKLRTRFQIPNSLSTPEFQNIDNSFKYFQTNFKNLKNHNSIQYAQGLCSVSGMKGWKSPGRQALITCWRKGR